jgi:hypothetical protein
MTLLALRHDARQALAQQQFSSPEQAARAGSAIGRHDESLNGLLGDSWQHFYRRRASILTPSSLSARLVPSSYRSATE